MLELITNIENWAEQKGILAAASPVAQCIKTIEELTELLTAEQAGNRADQIDAVGDVLVTLIIQAKMQGIPSRVFAEMLETEVTEDEADGLDALVGAAVTLEIGTKMLINLLDNDFKQHMIGLIVTGVIVYCKLRNYDPVACLQDAYNVISKRTGKMVNGMFVKDQA